MKVLADPCTNPNCKAKKWSTHTTANFYWPGGGKEGQFPLNFGQRARVNVASSKSNNINHFVLLATAFSTGGESGVILDGDDSEDQQPPPVALISRSFASLGKGGIPTFMDSGASDTMFVSKDTFSMYRSVTPRSGDSAKAVDGGFDIIGEGTVTRVILWMGRRRN